MKVLFAILLSLLMLRQLLPVGQWLQGADVVFAAVCDEEETDAPAKKGTDVKGDGRQWIATLPNAAGGVGADVNFRPVCTTSLPFPLLEYTTPPPDAC